MKNITRQLSALCLCAWVGSLWAIGYLAVPVLFYAQPDRQLAGMLAGVMFSWSGYIGLLCGAYLLSYNLTQPNTIGQRQLIAAMLIITLITQFGIGPAMNDLKLQALPLDVMKSAFAGQFKILHGLSSMLYLIESLLGVYLVTQSRRA